MKFTFIHLFLVAVIGVPASVKAQGGSEEDNLLSNPRFQSMLRSVRDDPGAAVDSAVSDSDALVDEATRLFQENRKKVDTSAIDTPENREKAKKLSEYAVSRVNEMKDPEKPEANPAEANPEKANVPATRAASTTNFVKPIAMPVEETTPQPLATDTMPDRIVQEKTVEPIATADPTQMVIPDFAAAEADIPAPVPLSPKYEMKNNGGFRAPSDKDNMIITARESVMDNNRGVLVFTGNVFVQYPNLDIKCEKLEIELGSDGTAESAEGGQSFKRAIASGGMVEVTRIVKAEKGKTKKQIAMARQVVYERATGDAVLTGGPPYIQDGESFIETNSPDAQIIMRGDNKFEIKGSDAGSKNRTRIVIPLDNKKNGANPNIGIDGGLGNMLDQGRRNR
ncbi:MAG: LptA/OstA family protein [Verrucomicrobiota bacterium]